MDTLTLPFQSAPGSKAGEFDSEVTFPVCETCAPCFRGEPHDTPFGLLQAASSDCQTCHFLLSAINNCSTPEEIANNGALWITGGGSSFPIKLTWWVKQESQFIDIQLNACAKEAMPTRHPSVGLSPESLCRVQRWLGECTRQEGAHHKDCGIFHGEYLPTRLLEIEGIEPELSVRLRDQKEYSPSRNPEAIKYVALSHCWGPPGSPRLTTTRETLETRKIGIPWSDIPRTFQDAIAFTHRLGVRYLWLDSLCIIQGDIDDWRNEAAQMAEVYSNSYLTIAAANAAHSGTGLFRSIPLEMQLRTSMDVVGRTPIGQGLVIYAKREHLYHPGFQRDYPLMSRAWAYQERYLAPRVLFFMQCELGWTCWTCAENEQDPQTSSLRSFAFAKYSHTLNIPTTIQSGPDVVTDMKVICHWYLIIEEYSQLTLTFEKDKLPAIAGLAKMMQPHRNGRYFAGMWEDSLLLDLAWRRYSESAYRPRAQRAPTWSWASLDCEVSFRGWPSTGETVHAVAQILSISCDFLGPDTTGEVSSGFLTLSAPLTRGSPIHGIFPDVPAEKEAYTPENIFYLHLFHLNSSSSGRRYGWNIYLVLLPVEGVDGTFRRTGLKESAGRLNFDKDTIQTVTII